MVAKNNLKKPTVIVGGGFAGLFAALHLRHKRYENPTVLIDLESQFVFKPLLYEYLTGELHDEEIVPAYEELLESSGIAFVQGKVTQIDLQQSQVVLENGLHYDYEYLVLTVGSTQSYFGTEGAEEHAFSLRTQSDALQLKQHLQDCLQRASQASDSKQQKDLLTVAIVGAGPSGVEVAATLADWLPSWYAQLGGNAQDIRLVLINHGDEVLKGDVNTHLQETALRALKHRAIPVELRLRVGVKSVDANELNYQAKEKDTIERLAAATTVWTAGTATNPLMKSLSLPESALNKHGLPFVLPTLQLPNFPEVFIAGDCAVVKSNPQPLLAQIAYQQGTGIARNLIALSRQQSPQPVRSNMRGTLMKLGVRSSVADVFSKVQVTGEAGDLIRKGTYIEMLPTPVHNFKATAEWLTDEIFERHRLLVPAQTEEQRPDQQNRAAVWIGGMAIALILIIGLAFVLKPRQPSPTEPQPSQPQSRL